MPVFGDQPIARFLSRPKCAIGRKWPPGRHRFPTLRGEYKRKHARQRGSACWVNAWVVRFCVRAFIAAFIIPHRRPKVKNVRRRFADRSDRGPERPMHMGEFLIDRRRFLCYASRRVASRIRTSLVSHL